MIAEFENEIREAYPEGITWQKTIPTFHPESAEEAADIFRRSGKYGQKIFISGFGNNIDPVGDRFADWMVIKSDRLNDIKNIVPPDFYITVGAGYPLKEINQVIDEKNLWFPFSRSNYPGSCGGALAVGLAGNDGDHTVPLSRYLLSVTAVLPDGSIVSPGAKTFKSVSGYDISRIFFNSWGTVGLVTELTFRVLPLSKLDQSPHLALLGPDKKAFEEDIEGDSTLSEVCRRIRNEYDPGHLLQTA